MAFHFKSGMTKYKITVVNFVGNKKVVNLILQLFKIALPFIILLICLAFLYKGQLFNLKPTVLNFEGTADLRSHIAKIELVRSAIVNQTGWPSWTTSSYLGFPPFEQYPPLFYVFGSAIAIFTSAVVSYKILILLNFLFSAICFSFFIRRATNLSKSWVRWAGIIFALSPSLLLLHMYGAEPNLFAWNTAILTLSFYCWPQRQRDYLWAVIWLAITILLHPYPVIFLSLILFTWTLIKSFNNQQWYKPWINLFILWVPAVAATIWWWLPAVLTMGYLSQLADPFVWQQINSFIILIILFATVFFIYKEKEILKNQSIILIGLAWSCFLTWGARDLMPVVGQFLHNSRFANLGIISFCLPIILTILYRYRQRTITFNQIGSIPIVIASLMLFTIFFVITSFYYGEFRNWSESMVINFESNAITHLIPSLDNKRVIVSTRLGRLSRADSLVTYAPFYNFQSVTGAYSQGDPKFFNFTVHIEWEERWLFNKQTLNNIMGAAGADYLLVKETNKNRSVVDQGTGNKEAMLFSPAMEINQAAITMPALLDVSKKNVQLVTDTINLLLPDGYQLPLVDAHGVDSADYNLFPIIVSEDEGVIQKYPKAQAYLVFNQDGNFKLTGNLASNSSVYLLPLNLAEIKKYFYQGKPYEYMDWLDFDVQAYKNDYVGKMLDLCMSVNETWNKFKNDNMTMKAVRVDSNNKSIRLSAGPGSFVIIRQSWFPRWQPSGGKLWRTTQGFMLGYLESDQLEIKYQNTWQFLNTWAADKLSASD